MLDKAIAYVRSIADGLLQPRKRQRADDSDGIAVDSNDMCAKRCRQNDNHFDLLSLPDSGLMKMISFMSPEDQLALFQTSRASAKMVMSYHADKMPLPRCIVYKSTTWKGLREVLSWIQAPLCLVFQPPDSQDAAECKGISAYDVFLGSATIPSLMQQAICDNYKFPCVQEIDVVGCKLRSLVPRVLAATCPNIQYCYTCIKGFMTTFQHNVEQLHPCLKLKQLLVDDEEEYVPDLSAMTPMPHHSAAEMVAAFPNIEALHITDGITPFVLQAFSQQVSVLTIHPKTAADAALIQSYSKLHVLKLHGNLLVNNLLPMPAINEHLKLLELYGARVTDSIFEQLLQLPNLDKLTVDDLHALQQDYSNRAFKQRVSLQMYGQVQELRVFAKLPLSSFWQCMLTHQDLEIHLPDPAQSDSSALMRKIAEQIIDTGLRVFIGRKLRWVIPETASDADAAALFSVAVPVWMQERQYDLGAVTNRPALLAAVLDWAAPHIEHIHMRVTPEASKPYVWQMLQRLKRLARVTLTAEPDVQHALSKEELLAQVCDVICSAAKHLVEPARKPDDCLEFTIQVCLPKYEDEEASQHVQKVLEIMDDALPQVVGCKWCEVFENHWVLTLESI